MKTALIVGGAAIGVWFLFFRSTSSGVAQTMPSADIMLPGSYPTGAGLPSATSIPPAVFVPSGTATVVAKANDAPNAALPPPPSTWGSLGSATVLKGGLGSGLIPGVSAGIGTAPSPIFGVLQSRRIQLNAAARVM